MTRHRVTAGESLHRADWLWSIFDRTGRELARGSDRVTAINRTERAEGRGRHRDFLVCRQRHSGERWERRGGSWFPIDKGKGQAA